MDLNPNTNENAPTPAVKQPRKRSPRLEIMAKTAKAEREAAISAKKSAKSGKAKSEKAAKSKAKTEKKSAKVKKEKAPKAPKLSKAELAAKEVAAIGETDVKLKTNVAPAVELNTELQTAFDFFNKRLFSGKLAPVMFSNVKRLKRSLGHHWPASWARRKELKGKIDEIGLNFAALKQECNGDKEVLSTLVHEMCHQLVSMTGKRERGHGHMWVAAMALVGLEPIILDSKGVPTGKATGPNASHTIIKGGEFCKAADELLKTGFKFSWFNEPMPEPEKKPAKKKKAGAKAKHTCSECGTNMYDKPSAVLMCHGTVDHKHDPVEMDCDRAAYESDSDHESKTNEGGDDTGDAEWKDVGREEHLND